MGIDHSDVMTGNEFERDKILFGECHRRLTNTLSLDVINADSRGFFRKDSIHTDLHIIVLGQTGRDLEIHGFVSVLVTFVLVVDQRSKSRQNTYSSCHNLPHPKNQSYRNVQLHLLYIFCQRNYRFRSQQNRRFWYSLVDEQKIKGKHTTTVIFNTRHIPGTSGVTGDLQKATVAHMFDGFTTLSIVGDWNQIARSTHYTLMQMMHTTYYNRNR